MYFCRRLSLKLIAVAFELKFSYQVDGKISCLFLLFVLKKYSEIFDNFDQVIFKVVLMNVMESICDG